MKTLSHGELRALGSRHALDRLGPYLLLRRLGVGGMAEVFLARLERPGSPLVVVKRMLPQLAQQERYVEMFRREARVALRLEHPNIVKVHGLVEDQGQIGLVMEYLEGLTLFDLAVRSWDAGRSLPLEPLVKMLADAARALHFAHHLPNDSGSGTSTIVHRDVSPDNLLVTKQGVTKLLDFGVAKPDDDLSLTRTGQVKGKVSYMSPEQARGEKLDGRSDLFSLGVSFYWLLTGVRPFDRDNPVSTMEAVILADIPRPSELNDQLPRTLELVVLRLLERDRRFRTATGMELAEQLDGLLGRVPRDYMSPARLLENVLDVDPTLERPWPTHVAVPSVDWVSGERKALADPSAPLPTTGDWAALETRQLPVLGLRELLAAEEEGAHSSVFTNVSLESLASRSVSDPLLSFDHGAPTIPNVVPLAPDTVRMPLAPGNVAPGNVAPTNDPATVPIQAQRSTFPSEIETDPESPPVTGAMTGAVTQPVAPGLHAFAELPPAANSDPDTLPETRPPTVETPQPRTPRQRLVSVPDIPGPKRSSRSSSSSSNVPVIVGAALLSVVTSAALVWAFLVRTEPRPPPPLPVVSTLEQDALAVAPDPPAAEDERASSAEAVEVQHASASPPDVDERRPSKRNAALAQKKPRTAKKEDKSVQLRAPAHVTWKLGKRPLGRGARTIEVPDDVATVRAYDTKRRVAVMVPIEGGVADWDALPKEDLVVRVRPWAKVSLGSEELGLTPLKPIPVVPGRYKLRLEWEGTVKEQTVRVAKGAGQVVVNVDMRAGESVP